MAEALLAGADRILLNRFLPGGRGLQYTKELQLNEDDIHEMLATADDVLRTANRYGHVGTELPACLIGDSARFTNLQVGSRCSAAVDFFVIDPSGFIRVCNHSPVRLLHFSKLNNLAQHPYWRRFATRNYLPQQCSGCHLESVCDGGCREAAHVACGSPDAIDPSMPSPHKSPCTTGSVEKWTSF